MSSIRTHNNIATLLGLATFSYLMLFVWQGLDFTDMGFWLTGYQQFYTDPNAMGMSVCWLTYFIGHWVGIAFGGSVLAYKFGYVIVITTSAMLSYRLLATQLGQSKTLGFMVLLTVFFTRGYGGNWIGYNELTALLYLFGAALLFFGLVNNRKSLVIMAGIVLASNLFIRFPNLLGIILVTAIWLYAWALCWTFKKALAWSAYFLGGFILGIFLIWLLILLHGHQAIYIQGIQTIFGWSVNTTSHHPGAGLVKTLITDHIQAFSKAFFILVMGVAISIWISKQKKLLKLTTILAISFLLACVFYSQWRWCVPSICYIVLLLIVFLKLKTYPSLALLAFISGMILFLAPLGSNNGISNSIFGMWLALPFTLTWLWKKDIAFSVWIKLNSDDNGLESNNKIKINAEQVRILAIVISLALFFQTLVTSWQFTYSDSKNRYTMSHSIQHSLLAGTYTTAERTKVVTELLDAMSHYIKSGDEILAYNAIPTIYFLTETRPWLGNPWPDFLDTKKLADLIKQKELTNTKLPYIVRAKGSTYVNSWPINAQPLATFWHQDESRQLFSEFEKRHWYRVIWSNEFFEILTTTK